MATVKTFQILASRLLRENQGIGRIQMAYLVIQERYVLGDNTVNVQNNKKLDDYKLVCFSPVGLKRADWTDRFLFYIVSCLYELTMAGMFLREW